MSPARCQPNLSADGISHEHESRFLVGPETQTKGSAGHELQDRFGLWSNLASIQSWRAVHVTTADEYDKIANLLRWVKYKQLIKNSIRLVEGNFEQIRCSTCADVGTRCQGRHVLMGCADIVWFVLALTCGLGGATAWKKDTQMVARLSVAHRRRSETPPQPTSHLHSTESLHASQSPSCRTARSRFGAMRKTRARGNNVRVDLGGAFLTRKTLATMFGH